MSVAELTWEEEENLEWEDAKWQQTNSLRSSYDIKTYFPNFPQSEIDEIARYEQRFHWGITPYTLDLMAKDDSGNPSPDDPITKQFFPVRGFRLDDRVDNPDEVIINWEIPDEFPTPILHHKYPNKVILRTTDNCLGYCGACCLSKRVSEKQYQTSISKGIWQASMDYIEKHPEIQEVIFSGGDPLMLSNDNLQAKLENLNLFPQIRSRRIHTRALTHNPYRVDERLADVMLMQNVNGFGIQVCHPNEITDQFKESLDLIKYKTNAMIFAQLPLLKGVNDDSETLEELFYSLYERGVKPYYLIHAMPHTPTSNQFRTSVTRGIDLMLRLKRRISNLVMPEYIIVHSEGKHTVPLEPDGTPEFQYMQDDSGNPIIRFKNWRGNWETYLDGRDD